MDQTTALRQHLGRLLGWHDAHVTFDDAVAELAPPLRGVRPAGQPHSPWELLEHLRLAQADILDFCRNPQYQELSWPGDYWPATAAPPSLDAWDASVSQFQSDRSAMRNLAEDPATDLFRPIPHGSGQTILRELLLLADHNAYHVGQLVLVRRQLDAWPSR